MELNSYIDHTNLKVGCTIKDIDKLCNEAIKYHFNSVYVYPYYVKMVSHYLTNTNILVGTVVGFPNGCQTKESKVYEAIDAVSKGADMIDMVINISALKNKDYDYIKEEIEEIRDAIDGKVLKVIIETNLLTDREIIKMTQICNETYVNYIKTCTGFNGGVKMEQVDIINKYKNNVLEIKASGGINNKEFMISLIEEGVSNIGTSHGVEIMEEK